MRLTPSQVSHFQPVGRDSPAVLLLSVCHNAMSAKCLCGPREMSLAAMCNPQSDVLSSLFATHAANWGTYS